MSSASPLHSPTRAWLRRRIAQLDRTRQALSEPPPLLVTAAQTSADAQRILTQSAAIGEALRGPINELLQVLHGKAPKENTP